MPSFQIFVIDGERPHLGAAVRQDRHQTLHSLGVRLEGCHIGQRIGLCGECRIRLAVGLAACQPFPVSQASKNRSAVPVIELIANCVHFVAPTAAICTEITEGGR
jgi:hypothetical protein